MTRLSPDERRRALLDAGQAVFAARPFEAVSMAELARAAGVSKGLVYHYFDDKQGFYDAVLARVATEVLTDVQLDPALPVGDAATHALRHFLAYARDNGPFYRALVRGAGGHGRDTPTVVERVRRAFVSMVREHPGGSAVSSTLAYGWVGMVEFAVLEQLDRAADDARDADLCGRLAAVLTHLCSEEVP